MPRRERTRAASDLAEERASAVQELLAGRRPSAVAKKYGVSARTLERWRADFLDAGERALVPKAEPRQRWTKKKRVGRPPRDGGKAMLDSIHLRLPRSLKRRLAAYAKELRDERGEPVSLAEAARELLEEGLAGE